MKPCLGPKTLILIALSSSQKYSNHQILSKPWLAPPCQAIQQCLKHHRLWCELQRRSPKFAEIQVTWSVKMQLVSWSFLKGLWSLATAKKDYHSHRSLWKFRIFIKILPSNLKRKETSRGEKFDGMAFRICTNDSCTHLIWQGFYIKKQLRPKIEVAHSRM